MTEISFTSSIKPVPLKQFWNITTKIGDKNSVDFPWTINQSVKAAEAYTTNICDCTVCGISNGQDVLMLHLTPDNSSNHNFYFIKQFIAQNIKLGNPNLQGILIGSKLTKKSQDIYNKFSDFLNEMCIPFSELKVGKDRIHAAYSSLLDTWYISSLKIDNMLKKGKTSAEALNTTFQKTAISKTDEIG